MSRHLAPYPPVGTTLALWSRPDAWVADVRVLARADKGDVLVRVVRSASVPRGQNLRAKILRSGRWKFRVTTGHRGGAQSIVRGQYEGNVTFVGASCAHDLDAEHPTEVALPGYYGNDGHGRAIVSERKSGAQLRRENRRKNRQRAA